jgi:hypothetical protein
MEGWKFRIGVASLALLLQGCAWTKEKVGDYVTTAAAESMVRRIDAELHKRDLSLAELKHAADLNDDGALTKDEIIQTAKLGLGDYLDLRFEKQKHRVLSSIAPVGSGVGGDRSNGEGTSIWKQILSVLGLITLYLLKQVWSAKQDAKRDARIAIIEKATNGDST